mgnify:CR=1 FL=1
MLDETKAIKAKDVVNDPDSVYGLMRPYILLNDVSMTGSYSNMMDAITILADAGWEVVEMSYYSTMYVMMKNLNYKRKNG